MTFEPTHFVPDGGMASWEAPDPARPSARLDQWLPVQLVERRGEWAHIACSNGWATWVDARRLEALPSGMSQVGAPPRSWGPDPQPSGSLSPAPPVRRPPMVAGSLGSAALMQLGGAAAIALGSFLGWISGFPGSSFDIPVVSLIDTNSASGPDTGLFLVAAAAVLGARAFVPALRQWALAAAIVAAVLPALFVVQLARTAQGVSVTSILGIGVYVTLAGGVVALIGSVNKGNRP